MGHWNNAKTTHPIRHCYASFLPSQIKQHMGGERGGERGGVYIDIKTTSFSARLHVLYKSALKKKSVWYMYLKIKHGLFLQVHFSFSVCCLLGYHNGCPG